MFQAWRARRRPEQPQRIYTRLVAQAREPAFYEAMGVEDTLEGRFDLLMLHVWLALRRLREEGPHAAQVLGRVPSAALMRGELDFPKIVETHPA